MCTQQSADNLKVAPRFDLTPPHMVPEPDTEPYLMLEQTVERRIKSVAMLHVRRTEGHPARTDGTRGSRGQISHRPVREQGAGTPALENTLQTLNFADFVAFLARSSPILVKFSALFSGPDGRFLLVGSGRYITPLVTRTSSCFLQRCLKTLFAPFRSPHRAVWSEWREQPVLCEDDVCFYGQPDLPHQSREPVDFQLFKVLTGFDP
ncbi:hypothetical protein EYF80_014972 [Liparis tanakae]|uniref:Uncharacterized protein n=1 Tax=Liparis tanakae TaxID=230148 RepID=A0A4Z2IBT2_9TELE|nr:hypothetical protein EYF80_014972 [Liparis tanakae]